MSNGKKLPCNHIFHAHCLRSWFQRQQSCPTCRQDVLRPAEQQQQQQQQRQEQQRRQDQTQAPQPQQQPQGFQPNGIILSENSGYKFYTRGDKFELPPVQLLTATILNSLIITQLNLDSFSHQILLDYMPIPKSESRLRDCMGFQQIPHALTRFCKLRIFEFVLIRASCQTSYHISFSICSRIQWDAPVWLVESSYATRCIQSTCCYSSTVVCRCPNIIFYDHFNNSSTSNCTVSNYAGKCNKCLVIFS